MKKLLYGTKQQKNILDWLEKERNILQNTGSLMWHRPDEQAKTLDVAKSIDTTIQYIKLSLFPETKSTVGQ